MKPCPTKSFNRPGVAMRISTPRRSCSTCGFWFTPPKMTAERSGRSRPYCPKFSWIWIANSRVGVRMSARIGCPLPRAGRLFNRWSIGSANAAVLPVPVWAQPSTSRPASTSGMVFS